MMLDYTETCGCLTKYQIYYTQYVEDMHISIAVRNYNCN